MRSVQRPKGAGLSAVLDVDNCMLRQDLQIRLKNVQAVGNLIVAMKPITSNRSIEFDKNSSSSIFELYNRSRLSNQRPIIFIGAALTGRD